MFFPAWKLAHCPAWKSPVKIVRVSRFNDRETLIALKARGRPCLLHAVSGLLFTRSALHLPAKPVLPQPATARIGAVSGPRPFTKADFDGRPHDSRRRLQAEPPLRHWTLKTSLRAAFVAKPEGLLGKLLGENAFRACRANPRQPPVFQPKPGLPGTLGGHGRAEIRSKPELELTRSPLTFPNPMG